MRGEMGDMELRHQQERRKREAEVASEREASEIAKAREESLKLQVASLEIASKMIPFLSGVDSDSLHHPFFLWRFCCGVFVCTLVVDVCFILSHAG